MSSFNLIVEDSSPLILYSPAGAWVDTPSNDPLASLYSGSSYHITSEPGATATISFNGTGLSIFGGMRSNYGTYIVMVDGQTITTGSAQDPAGNVTRKLLGAASGLSYGSHTAVITNINGAPIDIDWIDLESRLGVSPSGIISNTTIDNTDPSIVYAPLSAWQTANVNPAYYNNTLRFSQVPGASASLNFSGAGIALYGTVSPDHANVVVTIDGQSQTLLGGSNGFVSSVHTQTLLYYQNDLTTDGTHFLQLTGNPQGAGQFIDLDAVIVFTAATSGAATAAVSSQLPLSTVGADIVPGTPTPSSVTAPSTSGSTTSRHSTGMIVGSVLGGLIVLLIALGIIGFVILRRRRKATTKIEKSMISVSPILPMQRGPQTPVLPFQPVSQDLEAGGTAFPFPVPRKAYSPRRSIASSFYSTDAHSRGGSVISTTSLLTTPMTGVPQLNVPQPRSMSSRKSAPRSSGLPYDHAPTRPSTRPPTFDFTQMDR